MIPTIVIVDDDEGHTILIRQNLEAAGVTNQFMTFRDGQAALNFFLAGPGVAPKGDQTYLMLLDIRMPKVSGVEVLRQLKAHAELKKLPIIMLTTTDDAREVERCTNWAATPTFRSRSTTTGLPTSCKSSDSSCPTFRCRPPEKPRPWVKNTRARRPTS